MSVMKTSASYLLYSQLLHLIGDVFAIDLDLRAALR